MTRSIVQAGILGAILAGVPCRAQFMPGNGSASAGGAADNIEGFTVSGKGAASARPNRLEIDLEVSAASELSADAIVKYRDTRKQLQDAFAALKLPNVSVEERGLLVDQKGQTFNPYFMDTPPSRKGKVEVQLSRKLVVVCDKIRELDEEALLQLVAKLLDVAQDAGGKVGGGGSNMYAYYYYGYDNSPKSGLVRFVLDDFEEVRERAYKEAVDDARKRAGRLAKLSGVELGQVAGVREIVVPGDRSTSDDEMPRKRLESSRFQEVPVKVELQVRFATAASPAPKAGGTGR